MYFLTVESGARFGFAILAGSEADAETATRLLTLGLDWLGAGAKTAVGYGAFHPTDAATDVSQSTRAPAAGEKQAREAGPVPPLRSGRATPRLFRRGERVHNIAEQVPAEVVTDQGHPDEAVHIRYIDEGDEDRVQPRLLTRG